MAWKADGSASIIRKSSGEHLNHEFGKLHHMLNELKELLQAERLIAVKEKFERNRSKLETHTSQLILATSRNNILSSACNGNDGVLFSRLNKPLCKYGGFTLAAGDKDCINGHEIVYSASIKIPYIEKMPTYTTWIFLDRNQRMAEDQSVVGRRRIYYDQHGSEALICSDSEEELIEPEEVKHEFSMGEDRIIWTAIDEYGLEEQSLNIVSQLIGVTASEIEERFNLLKDKFHETEKHGLNFKDSQDSGCQRGITLDNNLAVALDSLNNLFCRRCLLFDCRLHGCSQILINPSEKQSHWTEHEDDRKPCSNQCYLQLRGFKKLSDGSVSRDWHDAKAKALEDNKRMIIVSDVEEPKAADDGPNFNQLIETLNHVCTLDDAAEASTTYLGSNVVKIGTQENFGKRKIDGHANAVQDTSGKIPEGFLDCPSKRQKNPLVLNEVTADIEAMSIMAHTSTDILEKIDLQMTAKETLSESALYLSKGSRDLTTDGAKDREKVHQPIPSSSLGRNIDEFLISSEWKPLEKELYLKGVEIFGKNSCLIARNLLPGLKTCIQVMSYMCNGGTTAPRRSLMPLLSLEEYGKSETDKDQEMSSRSRLIRRKGRTRKLKYSWKSAGSPSILRRIADGKDQSCKQYSPCGCKSMCGKQCPCLHNGTCCEKYCGCSKSCKNRFRGCHCAKSQCRSRQCPCFAAGRECDPDVCRNCSVSCGDGSFSEPPKRGDSQCGNMRLLLRQQQRILLGKSKVTGWGAFLKNPVNKNDYLGEYTGELISHREADRRGKIYDRVNSSFLFDLNDQYVVDAYRKGDKLKFANHSSNPNCYAKVVLVGGDHRVGIFANEHIEASEELFYDYRYGPDQAPAWARKPEGSKRYDSSVSHGKAKKHQSR